MTKAFLPQILEEKAREVSLMEESPLVRVRSTYRLYDFLREKGDQLQVIAEVKKASPSMGDINLAVDILEQARQYEQQGAAMISVLTDTSFFKGSIEDLRQVSNTVSIPTLNKDFIIDEKQIQAARAAGATVVLLIVAALSKQRLKDLYDYAYQLGLEVLVETHNQEELDIAHRIGAQIIGVNNRDLVSFETDIKTSLDLAPHFLPDRVYVSESAIHTAQDAQKVAPYFQAILVGTALMTSDDVAKTMEELRLDKS